jgi:pimeloyl-ACP methyl ester carboxylesterase
LSKDRREDRKKRRGVRAGRLLFLLAACAFVVWVTRGEVPPTHTGAWLDAQRLTPRYETVGALKIRYVRTGQGPTLVLLHGIASSIYSWKEVLPLLSRGHDVIALDFPGCGDSEFERNPSWESLPPLVTGLMDRLGVARATLVGSSMGGAVAVLAAAATPQRLDKLVLIDAAGFNLAPEERPAVLRLVNTGLAPVLERLPLRRPLTRLALLQIFHDNSLVTPERLDEYVAPMMRPGAIENLQALLASVEPTLAQRFENAARSVKAPTLVLWGDDDKWVPRRDADLFTAAIPGSRKQVIPACGHLPAEEKPAETAAAIETFLATGTAR